MLTVPLTRIINTSILTGTFPEAGKLAEVVPIHKKGAKTNVENYRPVSLLSVASKLLESIVFEQIMNYAERCQLLPSSQHGFRQNRSTTSVILSMISEWKHRLTNNKYVGVLLLDLSAAFDTICCKTLGGKLELTGFDSGSLKWIGSFMGGRKQAVQIGNKTSEQVSLRSGMPQGSIFSPSAACP